MTKNEFYSKWLEAFAKDISKKDIEKYVKSTGDYIWHIFSWGLKGDNQYLVGDEARSSYDMIEKTNAFYINWFDDDLAHEVTWNLHSAKALDDFVEVYVVDKDFKWTYIKTHESDCGPYFYKLK